MTDLPDDSLNDSQGSKGPPPHADIWNLTGATLGQYVLLRRIGNGAMSVVYLANQPSLHRQVAVKILKSDLATSETHVKRFFNEARSAAALVHPNVVQVFEVGDVPPFLFIAQEYVPGKSIRGLIEQKGALSFEETVDVLLGVAQGLKAADERGIVHRDVKPDNILLNHGGVAKVADFGLAKFLDRGEAPDLTQIGMTMGTPLYMSPEQVEGNPVDIRSDIYSLGMTAFHMLSGDAPYQGENSMAIAVSQIQRYPKDLSEYRPNIPESLKSVVRRMIDKQPKKRFQNPRELLDALKQIRLSPGGSESAGKTGSTSEPFATDLLPSTKKLQRWIIERNEQAGRGKRKTVWMTLTIVAAFVFPVLGWQAGRWLAKGSQATSSSQTDLPPVGSPTDVSSTETVHFPILENAQQQYRWAVAIGSVEAYEHTIKQFRESDNDRFYVLLARERLGERWLRDGRLDQAEVLYRELLEAVDDESGAGDDPDNNPDNDEIRQHRRIVGLLGLQAIFRRRGQLVQRQEIEQQIRHAKAQVKPQVFENVESNFSSLNPEP